MSIDGVGWKKWVGVVAAVMIGLLAPVAVYAGSPPALGWSPTTSSGAYDYGTLNAGQSRTVMFTLTNSGGSASAELTVAVSGSPAFSIISDGCSGTSLGPRKVCNVTVQYAPTSPGENDSAALSASGKKAAARATITLTGTSARARPALATAASPSTVTLDSTGSPVLKDTATLSGGYSPTGTITFTLTLHGTTVDTEAVAVNGNGRYTTPTGYTVPSAGAVTGTYQWMARYAGDGHNSGAASNSGDEPVAVGPAAPALATTPSPTQAAVGATLTDSATLSGGYNPTGTITFTLADPNSTVVDTETVTVGGNGTYSTPTGFTVPAGVLSGTYQWSATYSGDGNNSGAHDQGGAAEQATVTGKPSPGLTTTAGSTSVTLGASSQTLKDTATLSGGNSPGGSITFTLELGGLVLDTETVTVSGNGTYTTPVGFTLPTNGTVTGTYEWVAAYSGDGNNNSALTTLGDEPVVVSPATAAVFTAPNPTFMALTQFSPTLTDTAVLSGGYSPTGTITFILTGPDGAVVDVETATVSGNGPYSTPTGYMLPATGTVTGTYEWAALYSGDGNNNSTVSVPGSEPVTIRRAAAGIVSTASPTSVTLDNRGSPTLTDTASLQNGYNPTGTITFTLTGPGGAVVDTETVAVSGNGLYSTPTGYTLPTATAVTGKYVWKAVYSGDSNNDGGRDQGGIKEQTVVIPALTAILTQASPGSVSLSAGSLAPLEDSATLSSGYNPTGIITFTLIGPDGTVADTETAPVSGIGTYTTPTGFILPPGAQTGTYQWLAFYSGDANNNAAASTPNGEPVTVTP